MPDEQIARRRARAAAEAADRRARRVAGTRRRGQTETATDVVGPTGDAVELLTDDPSNVTIDSVTVSDVENADETETSEYAVTDAGDADSAVAPEVDGDPEETAQATEEPTVVEDDAVAVVQGDAVAKDDVAPDAEADAGASEEEGN
jgi:hypothetical protein